MIKLNKFNYKFVKKMSENKVFFKQFSNVINELQDRYNIDLSDGLKKIFKIMVGEVIDREGLFKTIEFHKIDIYESLEMIISEMTREPSEIDLEISRNHRLRDMYRRGGKFLTSASFLSAIHKKFCNIPPFCRRR